MEDLSEQKSWRSQGRGAGGRKETSLLKFFLLNVPLYGSIPLVLGEHLLFAVILLVGGDKIFLKKSSDFIE